MEQIEPDELDTMAQRIAWAIRRSGRTLEVLADAIGCSHATLSLWRSGKTDRIASDRLLKFADLTGTETRWLITGEGPRYARAPLGPDFYDLEDALLLLSREAPSTFSVVRQMIKAATTQPQPRDATAN